MHQCPTVVRRTGAHVRRGPCRCATAARQMRGRHVAVFTVDVIAKGSARWSSSPSSSSSSSCRRPSAGRAGRPLRRLRHLRFLPSSSPPVCRLDGLQPLEATLGRPFDRALDRGATHRVRRHEVGRARRTQRAPRWDRRTARTTRRRRDPGQHTGHRGKQPLAPGTFAGSDVSCRAAPCQLTSTISAPASPPVGGGLRPARFAPTGDAPPWRRL